jgi:hypothetical protein
MADVLKILGQLDAAATTTEALYTAPNLSQVTISTLSVCNRTGAEITFRVSLHVIGAGADDKQFLFYDAPLAANSTLTATLGITLGQLDVVNTFASATGLSFNLFGVETSS